MSVAAIKLSLAAGVLSPTVNMPLEVQSISASGLAVLISASTPSDFNRSAVGSGPPEAGPLRFVLEKDGHSQTLQASLVWVELSNEPAAGQRLELIVDTGDQPGWWEVQSALTGE
jgi:hypothetical protein